eukprot:4011877-Amphidinium_carterae.1
MAASAQRHATLRSHRDTHCAPSSKLRSQQPVPGFQKILGIAAHKKGKIVGLSQCGGQFRRMAAPREAQTHSNHWPHFPHFPLLYDL